MPFLEKASGTGFQGPRYRRSIGEQFLTYLEAWKRPGWGWGMEEVGRADAWATFTACGQGLRSHSAPFRTPSPSPRSYSSLPASPQEIPAPARRNPPPAPPLPPPRRRRRWRGRWRGSGRSGKLWRIFFPPGDPLTTSLPKSTQVSLAGLQERRPELGQG